MEFKPLLSQELHLIKRDAIIRASYKSHQYQTFSITRYKFL